MPQIATRVWLGVIGKGGIATVPLISLSGFASTRLDVGETYCGGSSRHAWTCVSDSMKVKLKHHF